MNKEDEKKMQVRRVYIHDINRVLASIDPETIRDIIPGEYWYIISYTTYLEKCKKCEGYIIHGENGKPKECQNECHKKKCPFCNEVLEGMFNDQCPNKCHLINEKKEMEII